MEALIGEAYTQSEDTMTSQYNSTKHTPQVIFLGIDERIKDSFKWSHKGAAIEGAPYFAVDVTPKGSLTETCEKLLSDLKSKGYSFAPGRGMELVASDGE